MTKYELHLQERGLKQYTIDGAVDPVEWERQTTRIVFYLKENYGYQDEGIMRIEDYASQWLADGIRTYVRAVTLAEAIFQSVARKSLLTREEIEALPRTADLQATLRKIAIVNIKKHSGKSKSSDTEIRKESYANASLLRDQIAALAPTVIVAGNTNCWYSLVYDVGLSKDSHDNPKGSATVANGIVLCHTDHPSARRLHEFEIYEVHRVICEKLGIGK